MDNTIFCQHGNKIAFTSFTDYNTGNIIIPCCGLNIEPKYRNEYEYLENKWFIFSLGIKTKEIIFNRVILLSYKDNVFSNTYPNFIAIPNYNINEPAFYKEINEDLDTAQKQFDYMINVYKRFKENLIFY